MFSTVCYIEWIAPSDVGLYPFSNPYIYHTKWFLLFILYIHLYIYLFIYLYIYLCKDLAMVMSVIAHDGCTCARHITGNDNDFNIP